MAHPVDAPYARVNKPQRPARPSSIADASAWGATAATESQSFPNVAAVAEQKYWELEPMHTYEETLHTRPRDDQIDFYAVGRHRDNGRDAGEEEDDGAEVQIWVIAGLHYLGFGEIRIEFGLLFVMCPADSHANHVYSEVNIKGSRDDPLPASPTHQAGTTFLSSPSSTRPVPRLPQRPASRPAHVPV